MSFSLHVRYFLMELKLLLFEISLDLNKLLVVLLFEILLELNKLLVALIGYGKVTILVFCIV